MSAGRDADQAGGLLPRAQRFSSAPRQNEIHGTIDQIAASGVAILTISSELPELIGMSDRIYVMRDGGVVAEIADREGMSQERIVDYICQREQVRAAAPPSPRRGPA